MAKVAAARLVFSLLAVWQVDNAGPFPMDCNGNEPKRPGMKPEQQARQKIDAQLLASGWLVQDYVNMDLSAGRGIALREVPLKTGPCDYLLLVDRKPVGVLEAKKVGPKLVSDL